MKFVGWTDSGIDLLNIFFGTFSPSPSVSFRRATIRRWPAGSCSWQPLLPVDEIALGHRHATHALQLQSNRQLCQREGTVHSDSVFMSNIFYTHDSLWALKETLVRLYVSVCGDIVSCTVPVSRSGALAARCVERCSSARPPCPHTSSSTQTRGPTPASTAARGSTRSLTWRSTRTFTPVSNSV